MSAINGASSSYSFPLSFLNMQSNVVSPGSVIPATAHQNNQVEGSESGTGSESGSGNEGSIDLHA